MLPPPPGFFHNANCNVDRAGVYLRFINLFRKYFLFFYFMYINEAPSIANMLICVFSRMTFDFVVLDYLILLNVVLKYEEPLQQLGFTVDDSLKGKCENSEGIAFPSFQ